MDKVYFSRISLSALLPSKIEENAGFDIYACFEEEYLTIKPNETKMIPTGIASACSSDYYFQLFERGSTGTKGIGQRCGVIDSGYRSEWFVPITNHNNIPIVITKEENIETYDAFIAYPYSKAICQAVLLPVPKVKINYIDYKELLEITSERGLGNLGSSGK
jgi:dUTP pyrophosphatase